MDQALCATPSGRSGSRCRVFGALMTFPLLYSMVSLELPATLSRYAVWLQRAGFAVVFGLVATATAVVYYRLRCLRESLDVTELTSVFD